MFPAGRLLVALLLIAAPTLCFLGLMQVLEKLRNDALLARIAERDDVSRSVSGTAARAIDADPGDGRTASSETLSCSACGEPNVRCATYCRKCLRELA